MNAAKKRISTSCYTTSMKVLQPGLCLKQQHPEIHSTLVLPYLDRTFNEDLYDDSTYPPLEEVPKRFALTKRNEWMVEQADVVVAYVKRDWGGAAATLRYAERKGKRAINISSQKS